MMLGLYMTVLMMVVRIHRGSAEVARMRILMHLLQLQNKGLIWLVADFSSSATLTAEASFFRSLSMSIGRF